MPTELDPTAVTVEMKPHEMTRLETRPLETRPLETKPLETKPLETKPFETKPFETKPLEMEPLEMEPVEMTKVTFSVDGDEFCVDAWPDLSALRTIRDIARHPRPRRGCEMGLCGSCESKVDGIERRLCQMTSASLDGVVIETPTPRRSMFAV